MASGSINTNFGHLKLVKSTILNPNQSLTYTHNSLTYFLALCVYGTATALVIGAGNEALGVMGPNASDISASYSNGTTTIKNVASSSRNYRVRLFAATGT